MGYEDAELRQAYIQGARDTLESLTLGCRPALVREAEEWLATDLAEWSSGDPPAAPYRWVAGQE